MAAGLYFSNPPASKKMPSWDEIDVCPFILRAALQTHLAKIVMDEEAILQMQVNTAGFRKALNGS